MKPLPRALPTRPCRCCAGTGVEPDSIAIGKMMRAVRLRDGLSLRDVGEHVGCSHVFVSDLETGRRSQAGAKARAIMAFLGVLPAPATGAREG